MKPFELINQDKRASLFYEAGTVHSEGLGRISGVVAQDILAVSGQKPEVSALAMEKSEGGAAKALAQMVADIDRDVILAGVLDGQGLLHELQEEGLFSAKQIAGKRECFSYQVLYLDAEKQQLQPMEKQQENRTEPSKLHYVWLVAGSDRLGAIYGLLEISRRIGVSDWCYWADAAPKKRTQLIFEPQTLPFTSKEPSVKLRGFFMNDEWPSLGNWVKHTFGDFNVDFYEQVFVLLLRLRGNFLWPAMWSASFPIDGARGNTTETDPLANARLADTLGITMSTSHHEPLMRASEEWDKVKTTQNNVGYGKDWNYFCNSQGLHRYWYDGVTRNAPFKNLYTLGMRGERDSKIMGDDAKMLDNVNLLKDTICDQKQILAEHGLADAPKVLALYKEVEDYYYGDETALGLCEWEGLEDVMLLMSDDNFANVRTLPTALQKNRKAGWGLYYHFDYHGGPISYEWVNSTALEKVWDQMTLAYEYGIRDLWIVNVGDVRPQELPLSYFMALAYDFETWGTNAPNQLDAFVTQWVSEQFQVDGASELAWGSSYWCKKIEQVLHAYTHMNANRRPEVVYETTFSVSDHHEAGEELQKIYALDALCKELWEAAPQEARAALYGLVYFPAVASANVRKMMIYAGYYNHYAKTGDALANVCHAFVQKCIALDKELVRRYHEEMADGKWQGMMMSNHVGFHHWNDEDWSYPTTVPITPTKQLYAWCENNANEPTDGVLTTEALTWNDTAKEIYVTISGSAYESLSIISVPKVLSVEVYPKFSEDSLADEEISDAACCALECRITLNAEAFCPKEASVAEFTAVVEDQKVLYIRVPIEAFCPEAAKKGIHRIECDGKLVMEASDAGALTEGDGPKKLQLKLLSRYGKYKDTLRMEPVTENAASLAEAPKASYDFWICHAGLYTVTMAFGPTNPLEKGKGQRFAFFVDGQAVSWVDRKQNEDGTIDSLPEGFVAGDYNDWRWNQGVLDNVRLVNATLELTEGMHCAQYFGVDAGVLLQRISLKKKQ